MQKHTARANCFFLVLLVVSPVFIFRCSSPKTKSPGYTVACYYFPNYHPTDNRNVKQHGGSWSEWELVKKATPRFPGHYQPKVPLWGYEDESDPVAMAKKIDAAADHGIDVFIFDWYYYDDGPFLEKGLEQGFLQARNNDRMKFSLMWANHDWIDIHPISAEKRKAGPDLLYPGKISPATWDKMTDYLIATYFKHPSYWKINGAPYFSVYDLSRFFDIFGSIEGTRQGIEQFRNKVKAAGFSDLHLNAVVWGRAVLPSEGVVKNIGELLKNLGFSSTTSYVWIHHVALPDFPQTDYAYVQQKYFEYANKAIHEYGLPYYPNVSMGWDPSPRTMPGPFENIGYPFMATISGNTPAAFKAALQQMKTFLDENPSSQKIFNINAWNEWTESSYLEPDTIHTYGYLQAIKEVFGSK
jgi:hypothetical protein